MTPARQPAIGPRKQDQSTSFKTRATDQTSKPRMRSANQENGADFASQGADRKRLHDLKISIR
jgi:hypothetical protein